MIVSTRFIISYTLLFKSLSLPLSLALLASSHAVINYSHTQTHTHPYTTYYAVMWMLMLNFYVNVICFDLSSSSNWISRLIYLPLLSIYTIYICICVYTIYPIYYSYLYSLLPTFRLSVWLQSFSFRLFDCFRCWFVRLFVCCSVALHTHIHIHTS